MPTRDPWLVGGRTRQSLLGVRRLPTDPHVHPAAPPHLHASCAGYLHLRALPPPPSPHGPPAPCLPPEVALASAVVLEAVQDQALAVALPHGAAPAAAVRVFSLVALEVEAAVDPGAAAPAVAVALPSAPARGEAPLKVVLFFGPAVVTWEAAVGLCCGSWTRSAPSPVIPNSVPAS